MKKIFAFYAFILFLYPLNAQYSVMGKISDQENQPLAGTTVYLPEINKGTVSDQNGRYSISDLPAGKFKVQFSYIGYLNIIETVIFEKNDIELDIIMVASIMKTEEIVITGGYSSTQHENAVKIEALKIDIFDIKTTPNFSEALTKVPGVNMISKGNGVSKPVIRGLSMNDILVLNNGVRFENYQYSSHHPLGIDEFGTEDVEVIKGPASLLYGSDAIGGVINFIKEKPAPVGTIAGDYNLQMFSNSYGITNNFGLKGAGKHLFGGIRIGQKSHADYLQGGGVFVPNTRFNENSVKINAGTTGKNGTFKLYYDYGKQNLGLAEEEAIELVPERGRKPELFFQQFNTHLISSQNKLYFGNLKVEVNSAYQNTGLIHFGEPDVYEIQMKLATLTYETKIYLPSDKNSEYIIGFQGMNQKNKNLNDRETILLPDAITNNYSVFTLLQRTLYKKLKVQAGIRYDYKTLIADETGTEGMPDFRSRLNNDYNSLSGSLGSTLHISEELLLRANFAAAFRTPNLAELTSNGQHETRYEIGDQNLSPENSYELDMSMHYHHENYTIDIAGFYNRINDYIYISPTGDTTGTGVSIYKYRQDDSYLFGAEAGIHFHPSEAKWLHLMTTYSTVTGIQNNGANLPFIPADKLYFEVRAEKGKAAFLNNAFVMVSPVMVFRQNKIAIDETPTDDYLLFDLAAGGNIKIANQNLSVMISVSNLFDKIYVDHLSTLKEVGFYNPGRNISLTLKIPFELKNFNKETE
ncbi:MAG: TonB-dependent receptor [Bacteroidetes bacterium]|nr:TonB-dependent receptor [Bacteroidota bacterium]